MGPQGGASSTQVLFGAGRPAPVEVPQEALHGGGSGRRLSHPRSCWSERSAQLGRAWGAPRPPQPFDQASWEAPPPQPGSLRSKLPITLEFSTFLSLWKKHPRRQPIGYGNSVVSWFSLKHRQTKFPSQVAGFLWVHLEKLSNMLSGQSISWQEVL